MKKVYVRHWSSSCPEGCCYNYGSDLTIDDTLIGTYKEVDTGIIEDMLKHLGIEYELEEDFDYKEVE